MPAAAFEVSERELREGLPDCLAVPRWVDEVAGGGPYASLDDLLDAAGVEPGAKALRFTCFDGIYTESLTLAQARRPDMLVAYQMDDKPVTAAHGGPVRLYAAPMYFYKSAKWLSGITVTDRVEPGYWEHYGYDVDGWVGRSNGRDDAPTS